MLPMNKFYKSQTAKDYIAEANWNDTKCTDTAAQ